MSDKTIYSYCTGMVDFPNKYAFTIYFSGCNMDCSFCHNKHILTSDANYSFEEIYEEIKALSKIVPDIGVVLSGGEPTYNRDFEKALSAFKGYPLSLHTNGMNIVSEYEGNIVLGLKPFNTRTYIETISNFLIYHADFSDTYYREVRYVKGVDDIEYGKIIAALQPLIEKTNWNLCGVEDSRKE